MMKISHNGLRLIKKLEGVRLKAYQDDAGVWTIGYGSTQYQDGSRVKQHDRLSNVHEADQLFIKTLVPYEDAVNSLVKVTLNQHQYDALVSFAYNVGTGALRSSSLLRYLNQSNYPAAANQFLVWNKITQPHTGRKIVSTGLSHRREKERALFTSNERIDKAHL